MLNQLGKDKQSAFGRKALVGPAETSSVLISFERYLSETLGVVRRSRDNTFEPWTCLTCLLSIISNLYCAENGADDDGFRAEMAASRLVVRRKKT